MDAESALWLDQLRGEGPARERALARLRERLLGVARGEAFRRRGSLPAELRGDLEDLCAQAAHDALVAVLGKLDTFRGDSRFTTWATKFVILEVSSRLRRRSWHGRRVDLDAAGWERLEDSAATGLPGLESADLAAAVRAAISEALTGHQRGVFLAAVIEEVPIDVLAERLGTSRGSIYKTVYDARKKLRQALAAGGFVEPLT